MQSICFSLLVVVGKEAGEHGPSDSFHFVRSQKIELYLACCQGQQQSVTGWWFPGCSPVCHPGQGRNVPVLDSVLSLNWQQQISNFQLQEDGCTGASRLSVLLASTDQFLSTSPLPTCAVATPGAVMVLFGATLSLENASVGFLCTSLELFCALCWAFDMLEPQLVPAGKLCLVT